jgi:5-methylcytosine-specific restriction enzyme subunit McrC
MISVAHNLDLKIVDEASMKLQQHTLLDLIFERFLDHAEALLAQGLIKAYRQVSANRRAVRGRLLVGRNETLNAIHRERIYTQATEYDRNNIWNQVLFVATRVTTQKARLAGLRSRAKALALFLPEQNPRLDLAVFDHLNYTRRTEAYRPAMRYAELVLRRTSPDLQGGSHEVFALLFDMNKLWEAWVLAAVRRQWNSIPGFRVAGQSILPFWSSSGTNKVVKPDIVVRHRDGRPPLVLDTKWKVLERVEPSDDDLKQMYVYEKLLGVTTIVDPIVNT